MPELVPGFPVPADLEAFLAQLADDPSVIGPRGEDVEDDLARLLDQNSPQQARRSSTRVDPTTSSEWADEGSVDPAVAEHLIAQLEPIASSDGPATTTRLIVQIRRRSMRSPSRSIAPGSPVSTTLRIIVPTPDVAVALDPGEVIVDRCRH